MHVSAFRWLALLAGVLLLGSPAYADDEPSAVIERCLPRLDPARDVGVVRILQRCPELQQAWIQDSAAFGLPQAWRELGSELSIDSLRELAQLLRAADQPARPSPGVAAPSTATLVAVLADWSLPDDAGLLQRLLRWIRARVGVDTAALEPEAGNVAQPDDGLLARVGRVLGWIAFAVALGLLGWVLSREARAAGWLHALRRTRSRREYRARGPVAAGTEAARARPEAAPALWPGWWLEQLAARLAARGALRHPAAATAREITAAATLGPVALRRLELLTEIADAARYAPQQPSRASLDAAAEAGAALLEELR